MSTHARITNNTFSLVIDKLFISMVITMISVVGVAVLFITVYSFLHSDTLSVVKDHDIKGFTAIISESRVQNENNDDPSIRVGRGFMAY
jgi:hypothetical protein